MRKELSTNKRIEQLKLDLALILKESQNPIIAWSGGKDSHLLLYLLRELRQNINILAFQSFWDKHQKEFIAKIVKDWGLTVLFYRPNRLQFENNSLIAYYNIGENEIPVIQDVIYNENRCGIELGNKALQPAPIPPFLWDCLITGSKECDTHQLIPKLNFQSFNTERLKIATPLWNWTDTEVLKAIDYLDISIDSRVYTDNDETADTGNVNACFRCVSANVGEFVYCPKLKAEKEGLCESVKEQKTIEQ